MHPFVVISVTDRGQYRTAGFDTRDKALTYAGYRRGMPTIRAVVVLRTHVTDHRSTQG